MSLLTLNFPSGQNFEPSAETKDKILYTHKSAKQFSGISIPGLFQTTNHTLHLILFFLIFVIEGIATYFCFDEGVSITAILVAIFIDIVFAIMAHLPHKNIVKLKNQLIFTEGTEAINIQRKIQSEKTKQYLFYTLLFVLAGFKIYWFYDNYGTFDTTAILIIVSYTLAALLHIGVTGYALFGLYVSLWLNRDYNDFIKSNGSLNFYNPNEPFRHIFNTNIEIIECSVNKHRLTKLEKGKYQFETFGIMTDSDLIDFIIKQNDSNQKRDIIVEGIKHQLNIVQTNPNKNINTHKR
jgi:hypothetical protein